MRVVVTVWSIMHISPTGSPFHCFCGKVKGHRSTRVNLFTCSSPPRPTRKGFSVVAFLPCGMWTLNFSSRNEELSLAYINCDQYVLPFTLIFSQVLQFCNLTYTFILTYLFNLPTSCHTSHSICSSPSKIVKKIISIFLPTLFPRYEVLMVLFSSSASFNLNLIQKI